MDEETQEKINNLSTFEQNAQQLAVQRQSFQTQLLEIDSAIEELGSSKDAYKIIGSIMVKVESSKLREELASKKKLIEVRIKSVEKQEDLVREKSKKLQEEIMTSINAAAGIGENSSKQEVHSEKASKDKKKKSDN